MFVMTANSIINLMHIEQIVLCDSGIMFVQGGAEFNITPYTVMFNEAEDAKIGWALLLRALAEGKSTLDFGTLETYLD